MIDNILDEIDNHINAIDKLISQAQGICLLKDLSLFNNLRKDLLAFRGNMMSAWGMLQELVDTDEDRLPSLEAATARCAKRFAEVEAYLSDPKKRSTNNQ